MQQRPVRFYITQNDDQTVVRSVPIARAQSVSAPDERIVAQQIEQPVTEPNRPTTVAERVRLAVRRGGAGGRR